MMNMMQVGLSGMGRNGFMNGIMQSEKDVEDVVKVATQLIEAGYTADNVIEHACSFCNVNFDRMLRSEREKIRRKVEEVYKTNHNSDKRKD